MLLEKSLKNGFHSIFEIYLILTIHSILLTKFGSLSACLTLKLVKTQSKYIVLDFSSNHGLFGKNLHDHKFLLNWISCFRVKRHNVFRENRFSEKSCSQQLVPLWQ